MFNIVKKLMGEDKKLVEKGDYYFGMGNYKSALLYYKKALEINENNKDAKRRINEIHAEMEFKKGIKLMIGNNYNRAIVLFNEAAKLNKELEPKATEKINLCKKIMELRKKADKLYDEGNYEEAITAYNKVLNIFPRDNHSIDMIHKIDELKKRMKDIAILLNEMEKSYSESINDEIIEKLNELDHIGSDNLKIKKYVENTSLKILNIEINHKINEGKKLYGDGQYEDALKRFKDVVLLDNKNEEAIKYKTTIEKILKLRQDAEELYYRGEYKSSLAKLNEILDINPNDEYSKYTIQVVQDMTHLIEKGNKYYMNNEFEDALEVYDEILKLNPGDKHVKNIANQIIKNYMGMINDMTPEKYREIYDKCDSVVKFNPIIFEEYINKLKNLIDDIYESGDREKSIEILFYYWELIGGKGLMEGFELESSIKSINVIKEDKDKDIVVVGCEYVPKLRYAPLYCMDVKNKQILWKFEVVCDSYLLKVKDESIIIGCSQGYVASVNLKDGSTQWKIPTDNNAPVVDIDILDRNEMKYITTTTTSITEDVVFVGCKFGYIYAINMINGDVLWSYKSPHDITNIMHIKDILYVSSSNPTILSGGGTVYGIDIKTGYVLWQHKGDYIHVMKCCKKYNSVIIGTSNEMIYSINGNNGNILWKYDLPKRVIKSISLDEEGDILIAGSGESSNIDKVGSKIYAIDLKTGLEKWIYRAKSKGIKSVDMVNTKNGKIILAKGVYNSKLNITPVYILKLNSGEILWKYRAKGQIREMRAVISKNPTSEIYTKIDSSIYDILRIKYVPYDRTNSITIHNLDILDGNEICCYNISNNISELLVSDETNTVLVGCFDGRIYAFNKNEVENTRFIVLQEILKTAPIIWELLHNEVNHVLELINQKHPFSNPVKAKRLIDKAKKLLNMKEYYKVVELINESKKYAISNIELDVKLLKEKFELNTWEDSIASVDYINGDMPLYNVNINCLDDGIRIRCLKSIDKISPGESKSLWMLMLPVHKGKYPLDMELLCEDEEGNPLEKKLFEYWIEVESPNSNMNTVARNSEITRNDLLNQYRISEPSEEDIDRILNNISEYEDTVDKEEITKEELLKKLRIKAPDEDDIDKLLENY